MRAHGINSNPASTKPSTPTKSKLDGNDSNSGGKKRKLADLEEAQFDGADDDENLGPLTQTPTVKSESKKPLARIIPHSIKAEGQDTPKSNIMTSPIPLDEAADLMQFYPDAGSQGFNGSQSFGGSQTFSEASFSSAREFNDYTSANDYNSSNFGGLVTPVNNIHEGSIFDGYIDPFSAGYPENDPLNIYAPGIQSDVLLRAPVVPSNADGMMNPLPPRPQMASQVFHSSQFAPYGSQGLSDNPVVLE